MKIPYEDQTISTRAIALLAGAQHASIDVHRAHTLMLITKPHGTYRKARDAPPNAWVSIGI